MTERTGGPAAAPRSGRPVIVATLVHLLGGLLAVIGTFNGWLMLLALLPSAVVLVVLGRGDRFVRAEARAALNFQITWIGAAIVVLVATLVLVNLLGPRAPVLARDYLAVGTIVLLLIALADGVISVLAMIRASRGGGFRYPLSFRLVS